MYKNHGGRHFEFAKHLIKQGYHPSIFCANTVHNSTKVIEIESGKYSMNSEDGTSFVFVKSPSYAGNGKQRIKNMIYFYRHLFSVSEEYAKLHGKPDVILASSVHPLTMVAGIKIAKKFGIPCICEVRDLWPESIVAYGRLRRNSIIAKILYQCERWIYKKADMIIFTMEGGKDYIAEQGWHKENGGPIDLNKVYHINNGVDLEVFNFNREKYMFEDKDLEEYSYKIVYTGSLREVNKSAWMLVHTAKLMQETNIPRIKFLIYGDGTERKKIEDYCKKENIKNVSLKGQVDKKFIPYILSKCDLNILNCTTSSVLKYGGSQNKLFDYLASGNPIISGEDSNYSIVKNRKCGLSRHIENEEDLMNIILGFQNIDSQSLIEMREHTLHVANDYDYRNLTKRLIDIIEGSGVGNEE